MSLTHRVRRDEQKHAEKRARGGRYAEGGAVHEDEAEDKALIKKELKRTKLEVKKHGGKVQGHEPHRRLDKRARGGKIHGHGKVNISIHNGGGDNPQKMQMAHQMGMRQGMQAGAALGAKAALSRVAGGGGPPGGPPPGGPPPQAMPGPRPPMAGPGGPPGQPMMARGGGLRDTESVAGEKFGERSGEGRMAREGLKVPGLRKGGNLVKVKEHHRRKAGGRLC